jgi:uncharacterized membrane protein
MRSYIVEIGIVIFVVFILFICSLLISDMYLTSRQKMEIIKVKIECYNETKNIECLNMMR